MQKKTLTGLVLLSGGFDSAVAAWMVQQQPNVELSAIHFSQERFVGKKGIEKTKQIAKQLKIKKLFIVDISEIIKAFVENANSFFYFVFLKRLFFGIAEQVAKKKSIGFLVTGENLGQVSSQTLSNIATVAAATQLPVVRPLLGLEKNEIIALSKKIGTHDISVGPELCDFLGPKHPATRSTIKQLVEEEKKIDLETQIKSAIEKMTLIELEN